MPAEKFLFLKSRRFWAMVLFALIPVFEETFGLSKELGDALRTILGGFVTVATVDKFKK
jgi:hypothetical protein